jgi:hypothetical protein
MPVLPEGFYKNPLRFGNPGAVYDRVADEDTIGEAVARVFLLLMSML